MGHIFDVLHIMGVNLSAVANQRRTEAMPEGPEKQPVLMEIQSCRNTLKILKMNDRRYGRKV